MAHVKTFPLAVIGVAASVMAVRDAGADTAAHAPYLHCTTLIAGKQATLDRSVLIAHSEDLGSYRAQHYLSIPRKNHGADEVVEFFSKATTPQVPVTFAYTASTIYDIAAEPGDITSGINEYQVSVANNMAVERDTSDPPENEKRVMWTEFTRTALERATTAREAVKTIGWLAETFRLALSSGTLFGVTDPNEGFWVEVTSEGQWVAQRVPDNVVSVRANTFRIGVVDFNDATNFMYSANLVQTAKDRGFYKDSDGPFDFAAVYADPSASTDTDNTHREERVNKWFATPATGVTPASLMAVLRDHYEGTPVDLTDGYKKGSPHGTKEHTICNMATEIASVCQSRGDLPGPIGAVCFRSMTTPCSGVFVPWYVLQTDVLSAYQKGTEKDKAGSAYWAFRTLSESVDKEYKERITHVKTVWNTYEADEACRRKKAEAVALQRYSAGDVEGARAALAAHTNYFAERVVAQAADLAKKKYDIIGDIGTCDEAEDGGPPIVEDATPGPDTNAPGDAAHREDGSDRVDANDRKREDASPGDKKDAGRDASARTDARRHPDPEPDLGPDGGDDAAAVPDASTQPDAAARRDAAVLPEASVRPPPPPPPDGGCGCRTALPRSAFGGAAGLLGALVLGLGRRRGRGTASAARKVRRQ